MHNHCRLCPRGCHTDRKVNSGYCGAKDLACVAKTMLHHWEEPPISGSRGSGAVFFSGCNLRCVFCQNHAISTQNKGRLLDAPALAAVFLDLQAQGAHNINLVSPTPYVTNLAEALPLARERGLQIPVIYNSNAYETVTALHMLDGLVDIYLPDFKYWDDALAKTYSDAPHYASVAGQALLEMFRQVGVWKMDSSGLAQSGLLVRHLVLPGQRHDSMRILDWVAQNIPSCALSLMAQYLPVHKAAQQAGLNRRITTFEYESVVRHALQLGLDKGYMQDTSSGKEKYIPDFT